MITRTQEVANRQFRSMGCSSMEIGIRDSAKGLIMTRQYTYLQFQKSISWLQNMNRAGNDIYIRPADLDHGLVLVDDIDEMIIEEMKENGHTPFLIIETSPQNFQVWVRVKQNLSEKVRSEVGRILAKLYNGDLNSADSKHFGRLAGFTNRKPKYTNKKGQQPFCLLRHSNDNNAFLAPNSESLIVEATMFLNRKLKEKKIKKRSVDNLFSDQQNLYNFDFEALFISELEKLKVIYKQNLNCSQADWMIGKLLLKKGCSPGELSRIILKLSPQLETRKKGHTEDYINRTVVKLVEGL